MAFTTQTFIFLFFPISMILYYITLILSKTKSFNFLKKFRITDLTLIGISCCFYLWACFDDLFRFAAYILLVYLLGIFIYKVREKNVYFVTEKNKNCETKRYFPVAFPCLIITIAIIAGILIHFKYTGLLTDIWNMFMKDELTGKSVIAPLGISFITFSAISYIADIYLGKATPGNIIDFALYMSFFPKVVSGPIVLWRDFKGQITERKFSVSLVSAGIQHIMIGFTKKLILADTFGSCINSAQGAIDVPTAWGISLLYMLQIYYDFSGYSDIAIGLAQMLGFDFKENFDFPYLSCSISEFWRRWHISLGTWFRQYIYFPLGGSRRGESRTILNVAIVFLLTGIWHGAGWTYMLWGIINGACNIIEKIIAKKNWYNKIPKGVKWFSTMGVTFFCWQLFRFSDISLFLNWLKIMLGMSDFKIIPYSWQYYFDTRMIVLMVIAIIGATLFGLPKIQDLYKRIKQNPIGYSIFQILYIALFAVSILFMINSTYSPFIYFQY